MKNPDDEKIKAWSQMFDRIKALGGTRQRWKRMASGCMAASRGRTWYELPEFIGYKYFFESAEVVPPEDCTC